MHIHPSSPNSSQALPEEIAATKIQAGFRGYRVRKQLKETESPRQPKITTFNSSNNNNNNNNNHINNKENLRLNQKLTDDSHNPASIGYNMQRNNKLISGGANGIIGHDGIEDKSATKIQAGVRGFLVRKKQKAATDAATKIQASFRGFKVRKDIKKNRK